MVASCKATGHASKCTSSLSVVVLAVAVVDQFTSDLAHRRLCRPDAGVSGGVRPVRLLTETANALGELKKYLVNPSTGSSA